MESRPLRDPDLPMPPRGGSGVYNPAPDQRRHELRLERIRAAATVAAAYIQTSNWASEPEEYDGVISDAFELLGLEFGVAVDR